MPTFKALFVSQRRCSPQAYARVALHQCLRWPARLAYWPLRLLAPDYFAADLDLINNVGRLTSPFELDLDITEYRYHPYNQNRLRRTFGLCLSTSRLRRLVFNTFLQTKENSSAENPNSTGRVYRRKRTMPIIPARPPHRPNPNG